MSGGVFPDERMEEELYKHERTIETGNLAFHIFSYDMHLFVLMFLFIF